MKRFLVAAAMAAGLVMIWAAIVPLTAAEPTSKPTAAPPGLSKALFLCRGANGIDQACAAALAKALVFDPTPAKAGKAAAVAPVRSNAFCRSNPQLMASTETRSATD